MAPVGGFELGRQQGNVGPVKLGRVAITVSSKPITTEANRNVKEGKDDTRPDASLFTVVSDHGKPKQQRGERVVVQW